MITVSLEISFIEKYSCPLEPSKASLQEVIYNFFGEKVKLKIRNIKLVGALLMWQLG